MAGSYTNTLRGHFSDIHFPFKDQGWSSLLDPSFPQVKGLSCRILGPGNPVIQQVYFTSETASNPLEVSCYAHSEELETVSSTIIIDNAQLLSLFLLTDFLPFLCKHIFLFSFTFRTIVLLSWPQNLLEEGSLSPSFVV